MSGKDIIECSEEWELLPQGVYYIESEKVKYQAFHPVLEMWEDVTRERVKDLMIKTMDVRIRCKRIKNKTDWQELKIDDLPRDICKEVDGLSVYEFQSFGSSIFMNKIWIPVDAKVVFILEDAKFKKYRFRKRQPEKKEQSYEDLANRYISENFTSNGEGTYQFKKYENEDINRQTFFDMIKDVFIAGRKSK